MILGFHAFTGCDQTGKFTGKSKLTCWKVFESSSSSVLKAFKQLGVSEGEVEPLVTRGLQEFVVQLHMGQSIKEEMSLLKKDGFCIQIYKIQTNYRPLQMYLSSKFCEAILFVLSGTFTFEKHHPARSCILWLGEIRWSLHSSDDRSITCTSGSHLRMSVCKCNTGCANQRCKFRKNKLVCTEMCQCSDCENVDNDSDAEWMMTIMVKEMLNIKHDKYDRKCMTKQLIYKITL